MIPKYHLGVDLFNEDEDFLSFDAQSIGGGFRLGKNISEYESVGLRYRLAECRDVTGVGSSDDVTEFFKNGTRLTSRVAANLYS